MRLRQFIEQSQSGLLLYGLTPPKLSNTPEKVAEIARKTVARINEIDIDGLIVYDINEEGDRNPEERPFPYLPTLDPDAFYRDYLAPGMNLPAIIYRCVGKYTETELARWLSSADPDRVSTVFVGASSREQKVAMSLKRAYDIKINLDNDLLLGGVLIAERHEKNLREHERLAEKTALGCSFFVSQTIYNVEYTKNILSDYHYYCKAANVPMRPVILTISVCGSVKTLEFMKWLGIHIPKWLENEIAVAGDPLTESYDQCLSIVRELIAFCKRLGIPYGFNVESVSIRLAEIEASIHLAKDIRILLSESGNKRLGDTVL